eukprot:scaffold415630_cov42-Prasinocladus_malaysianus.AAC.1
MNHDITESGGQLGVIRENMIGFLAAGYLMWYIYTVFSHPHPSVRALVSLVSFIHQAVDVDSAPCDSQTNIVCLTGSAGPSLQVCRRRNTDCRHVCSVVFVLCVRVPDAGVQRRERVQNL